MAAGPPPPGRSPKVFQRETLSPNQVWLKSGLSLGQVLPELAWYPAPGGGYAGTGAFWAACVSSRGGYFVGSQAGMLPGIGLGMGDGLALAAMRPSRRWGTSWSFAMVPGESWKATAERCERYRWWKRYRGPSTSVLAMRPREPTLRMTARTNNGKDKQRQGQATVGTLTAVGEG
jgi:hypothetical protein